MGKWTKAQHEKYRATMKAKREGGITRGKRLKQFANGTFEHPTREQLQEWWLDANSRLKSILELAQRAQRQNMIALNDKAEEATKALLKAIEIIAES